MRLSQKRIGLFQRRILTWWAKNRRDLPWRHTRDPYRIMVSEVMLQQTQAVRVIPRYRRFLKKFPTVGSLSSATGAEVLRMWQGLGYNRRALYLQKTAEMIMRNHQGLFPEDENALMNMPGLGKYTVRAILVFAYHADSPAVDTNIRRVITHFFYHGVPQPENEIYETAAKLVPRGLSWEWHQALMDYAALALPKARPPEGKSSRRPFKTSDRFFRGRIIDLLRDRNVRFTQLARSFHTRYGKDSRKLSKIVGKLVSEGLVRRRGDLLSLPE